MATETDIVNMGIVLVGGDQIDDIDDASNSSTEATLARLFYDTARDAVIEARNWAFASTRDLLDTPEVTLPVCEYDQQFSKPADCLRIVAISLDGTFRDKVDWQLEEDMILVDAEEIYIKYLKQVTDTTKFPNSFVHTLAAYIGMLFSIPILRNEKILRMMQVSYNTLLEQSSIPLAQQGTGPDTETSKNARTILAR